MLGRVEASLKPFGGHSIPVGSVARVIALVALSGPSPSRPDTTPPVLIVCCHFGRSM